MPTFGQRLSFGRATDKVVKITSIIDVVSSNKNIRVYEYVHVCFIHLSLPYQFIAVGICIFFLWFINSTVQGPSTPPPEEPPMETGNDYDSPTIVHYDDGHVEVMHASSAENVHHPFHHRRAHDSAPGS